MHVRVVGLTLGYYNGCGGGKMYMIWWNTKNIYFIKILYPLTPILVLVHKQKSPTL